MCSWGNWTNDSVENEKVRDRMIQRWRRKKRSSAGGDSEAKRRGARYIVVGTGGGGGEGRTGTHKAEILRAGAGAPRGLRRRNHNAARN